METQTTSAAISAFGAAAKAKLSNAGVAGQPEEQLRRPLEDLIVEVARLAGFTPSAITLVGETRLADLRIRPDYAVTLDSALVGFIEVKAPGKGARARTFSDPHDAAQWEKLKTLPNIIYTDGNEFSLWRDGVQAGSLVVLHGDVRTAGAALSGGAGLIGLITDFLLWNPTPPRSAAQLAETSARLCRLLRDEVSEQLDAGSSSLTNLAEDWRKLLFPGATDTAFADGYAQAVTFGLLMARARGIRLSDGLDRAARDLREQSTLIGTALRLLTDDAESQATLKTSLATLARVLDAVDWTRISRGDPEAWLYFYEVFLKVYDPTLRRKTGSYYTPAPVVRSMVALVDEALKSSTRFDLPRGLVSPEVTIVDPATGTGAFLLAVLQKIRADVEADVGAGAVQGELRAAMARLIGFELQFGPFAVAQLRLLAELQDELGTEDSALSRQIRLFVTDTLGNPFIEQEWIPQMLEPLADSRRQANAIKRDEKITVVIGNPPYKDKARGLGGWIEMGGSNQPGPLDDWQPPTEWNFGAHAKHLKNLYVYFWRWATWKVFQDGSARLPENEQPADTRGIICYITAAGFLSGDGFAKMRADLRRDAEEIWVIDCSPEGHQPAVSTRIFEGVQQPVCIVLALNAGRESPGGLCRTRYRSLPKGHRETKFAALELISLDDGGWQVCSDAPKAQFKPQATGAWADFPFLEEIFVEASSGVLPGRTWVVAPDAQSLARRWDALVAENDPEAKEALFFPTLRDGVPADRHTRKVVSEGLRGHPRREVTVALDVGPVIPPIRFGYRSFDRQWLIPDNRLLLSARPKLWEAWSDRQVYLVSLEKRAPENGPATTLSALLPDMNFFKGSSGGRVFQLWRDETAGLSNVRPEVTEALSEALGMPVTGEQLFAYIAALTGHPGFTAHFRADLIQPGLRVPLTTSPSLFNAAVSIGRTLIWLQAFGEREIDPAAGRPRGAPRLPAGEGPRIDADGAIPSAGEKMPDTISYDPAQRELKVGEGTISNVPEDVWAYEVSGKQVLVQWFSYRKLDRSRPMIGDRREPSDLEHLQPDGWLSEYTAELINLIHILGWMRKLEGQQQELLDQILAASLLERSALPPRPDVADRSRRRRADARQGDLLG